MVFGRLSIITVQLELDTKNVAELRNSGGGNGILIILGILDSPWAN